MIVEKAAAQSWQTMKQAIDELNSNGTEPPVYRAALVLPLTQGGITAIVGAIAEYPSGFTFYLQNTGGGGETFLVVAVDGVWRTWQQGVPFITLPLPIVDGGTGASTTAGARSNLEFQNAATKATPVDADSVLLIDSAAANELKRTTWANAKNVLSSLRVVGVGANYTTISAALAASSSGDIVLVLPSTYTESITVPAGVALIGLDESRCIINTNSVNLGDGSFFHALTVSPSAAASGQIITIATGNASLDRVFVTSASMSTTSYIIRHTGAGVVTIKNSTFAISGGGVGAGQTLYGIYLDNTTASVSLTNSRINFTTGGSWSRVSYRGTNVSSLVSLVAPYDVVVTSGVSSSASTTASVIGAKSPGSNANPENFSNFGRISLFGLYVLGATRMDSGATTTVPLTVRGAAGQTADLAQAQDSTGAVLQRVEANGVIRAAGYKSSDGSAGWTGTFLDGSGATVTVKNGLITSVV